MASEIDNSVMSSCVTELTEFTSTTDQQSEKKKKKKKKKGKNSDQELENGGGQEMETPYNEGMDNPALDIEESTESSDEGEEGSARRKKEGDGDDCSVYEEEEEEDRIALDSYFVVLAVILGATILGVLVYFAVAAISGVDGRNQDKVLKVTNVYDVALKNKNRNKNLDPDAPKITTAAAPVTEVTAGVGATGAENTKPTSKKHMLYDLLGAVTFKIPVYHNNMPNRQDRYHAVGDPKPNQAGMGEHVPVQKPYMVYKSIEYWRDQQAHDKWDKKHAADKKRWSNSVWHRDSAK